jgi:hypothetical protein
MTGAGCTVVEASSSVFAAGHRSPPETARKTIAVVKWKSQTKAAKRCSGDRSLGELRAVATVISADVDANPQHDAKAP